MTSEGTTVIIKFVWEPLYEEQIDSVKSVELILGQARNVNSDPFEDYLDGTSVKEDSSLQIHQLDACTSGKFEKSIELPPQTYQFLFRITDVDNKCAIHTSQSHHQTVLVTGRTVNYIEKDTANQNMEAFADIRETAPLMKQEQKEEESKNGRCGCGPDRCCLL